MKKATSRNSEVIATFDHLQQFSDCGFLRRGPTSGVMEPETEPMMKHIINCLWAMVKFAKVDQKQKSEKSELFHGAIAMISKLAASGLSLPVDLGHSTATSNADEAITRSPEELKRLQQQGEDMQQIISNSTSDNHYFWAPLYCTTIVNNSPGEMCLEVCQLYDEYLCAAIDPRRDNKLLCMDVLLGSKKISDKTTLYILSVLRDAVPWLFFVRDKSGKYALHYAAEYKCSPEIIQFLLQANPHAISAKSFKGSTPLHFILDDKYTELKHFDQFHLLLQAANVDVLRTKDSRTMTPLSLACSQHSPRAPKTVLALLQAYPEAAAMEDYLDDYPIHLFASAVKDDDNDGSTSNPTAGFAAFESLLAANKDAVSVIYSRSGDYVLNIVARFGTLDMLKLVYEANPEAIRSCERHGTPLHQAVWYGSIRKIEYLHSLYPEAAQMASGDGSTLLHLAVERAIDVLKLAHSYNPGAIRQRSNAGRLPLHELINKSKLLMKPTLPDSSEMVLRFLLRHYPEAAGILDDSGRTPYDMLPSRCNEAVKRLLLRAAPAVNISEFRRLNYEARRGALYLLFAAELPLVQSAFRKLEPNTHEASAGAAITTANLRRPERARKAKEKTSFQPAAIVERAHLLATPSSSRKIAAPSFSSTSTKIWRLLKDRGDKVLLKEIVLYL